MQSICIRQAAKTDIAELTALWEQFMTTEEEAISDADPLRVRLSWEKRLYRQIERGHVHVVLCAQHIAGFIGAVDSQEYQWVPAGILYIVDMYVQPAARSKAAARCLMQALEEAAKAAGYREIWTNTSQNNRRVQVLLTRNGFQPLPEFAIPDLPGQFYYGKLLSKQSHS